MYNFVVMSLSVSVFLSLSLCFSVSFVRQFTESLPNDTEVTDLSLMSVCLSLLSLSTLP